MSLSFIGALVALIPPALLHPKGDRPKTGPEIARLREDERRARELSNAYAALAMEKLVSAHWKEEARSLARRLREDREHFDRLLQQELRGAQQRQQAQLMNAQALAQQTQFQTALQQYNSLANHEQNAYQGSDWCNCVPGRAQVFEVARQRPLQWGHNVDPVGDRIAQLRP